MRFLHDIHCNIFIYFLVLTIDVMDLSGDNQDDIKDDVYKISLLDGKEGSGVRQG